MTKRITPNLFSYYCAREFDAIGTAKLLQRAAEFPYGLSLDDVRHCWRTLECLQAAVGNDPERWRAECFGRSRHVDTVNMRTLLSDEIRRTWSALAAAAGPEFPVHSAMAAAAAGGGV